MMKNRMLKTIYVFCLCLGILAWAGTAEAAVPRVMVSDYSVKGGTVLAGKEFTLSITLKNTATKNVKNVKVTVASENGELLPAEGAGASYVAQLDAESETELTFQMMAVNGLAEKAYKLSVKTEYESTGGMEYTVDENIFIPVSLEQRLSVTDIFLVEDSVEIGDVVEISAVVNNLGAGSLYNVTAKVEGDNVQETDTYVGNIEPGKSGNVDILTKADIVTAGDHKKNRITVSYEDQEGNVYEKEVEIGVMVAEPIYENLEKVKEAADHSKAIKTAVTVIASIVVIVLVVWLMVKRKKRKQQILDEFIN